MAWVDDVSRRTALATVLGTVVCAAARAQPGSPARGRLAFEVWRSGQRIGLHTLQFQQAGDDVCISIDAAMVVKLGPIPVFHYHHQATERWSAGRFAGLQSQTLSNGRRQQLDARRTAKGVRIDAGQGESVLAPPEALPLTHWNQAALHGPLFNPQTGAVLRETAARDGAQTVRLADGRSVGATRYTLSGTAEIVDWYDDAGVWTALRGKAPDGSYLDYRRSA